MIWIVRVLTAALGLLAVLLALVLAVRLFGRQAARIVLRRFTRRLFTDPYHENLWETVTAIRRYGLQAVLETELRAASGKEIYRPFGRFRTFPGFDDLLFDPAQLARLPTSEEVPVEMATVLGPRSARPLHIEIPLLITGMGYAVALSPKAKEALARGAAMAGTATNTGMGPLLPDERRLARSLILQFNRGDWNKTSDILRLGDAIEIQLGQGAQAGIGFPVEAKDFPPELRRAFGLQPGQKETEFKNRMPGMEAATDLIPLVARLRRITDGVPIGVKMAAGDHLESDLMMAVLASVDYVQLDGAEGGTQGSLPILADDFGLPTFLAVCRAHRFLAMIDPGMRPSLIISGGLSSPGHFLKALALGADAVAIGSAALFALAHNQTSLAVPWEPPLTTVVYGQPAARRLDVDKAAESLARFLASVRKEMESAVRAVGKTSVHAVGRDDLMALEPWVADVAGVHLARAQREVLTGSSQAQPSSPDPATRSDVPFLRPQGRPQL